jgi:hypothetical protein
MSEIAKPLQDHEAKFVDEDDSSVDETKKAVAGFTPTQPVSWPFSTAQPPQSPEEPETPLDTAGRTRGEGAQVNRVLANQEEAEKARQDDHRYDPNPGGGSVAKIEAKYETGFTRQAGKYTAHTGPLTRGSGRLKVFAESISAEELEEWTDQAKDFEKVAKQVLRGRDATIFEARVLSPMLGGPQRTPEDCAAQFNIKVGRVYKIEKQAQRKVEAAFLRFKQGKSLVAKDNDDRVCTACGRTDFSDGKLCDRGKYGPCERSPDIRSIRRTRIISAAEAPGLRSTLTEAERRAFKAWDREEAERESRYRDYLRKECERWEELYGPKPKPRLSEFLKAPRRQPK